MMRTRIDRYKIKQRMAMLRMEKFEELIKASGISQTTFYGAVDSYTWKAQTLDALANALNCQPWELTTREDVPETA